uniref:Protein translocase subunit SecA n=1 Tax=Compsopogon caeruleus TaxID=31354 RepID=A0A1Z1XAX2_9RHOD|nr:preprotein translocase subunit A [Compsopogon caeruleus]ARX96010.1 preprotein translocase subunit A [Compsopogon caeruleus]
MPNFLINMFNKIFPNFNERKIKDYYSTVFEINCYYKSFTNLSDNELKIKTSDLRSAILQGQTMKSILPEAFALVKEATRRVLGLTLFDVQLIGGIILHEGKIAEMKTGEGKTLVSCLPAFLNSLFGKGVHIITVNEYLAQRDSTLISQIYELLGLSVGLVTADMNIDEKKYNYNCDITYVTNSEVAFDYLKDNMVMDISHIVQRNFFYCIIDEVDSILIDEARTPLIIGGNTQSSVSKYIKASEISKYLLKDKDYEVDYKKQIVTLTDKGLLNIETLLNIIDLYDIYDPWAQYIINSLKAKELYIKDVHYIISNDHIEIIDEFTGRIAHGKRWSEGLHQAIEAKENLSIKQGMKTLSSITYQNFFLLYPKLSGMTGTAKTEEYEFEKLYKLPIVQVPTNKKMQRIDFPDIVYRTSYYKWKAVANECYDMYLIGRPVLVGTTNIESSELLSRLLSDYNLPHNLLNAKPENIKRESEIIAQAGRKKAITIATNMAGRGTDIILGGNINVVVKCKILDLLFNNQFINLNSNKMLVELLNINDLNSPLMITRLDNQLYDLLKRSEYWFKKLSERIHNKREIQKFIIFIIENKHKYNYSNNPLILLYQLLYNNYTLILEEEKEEVIKLGGLHVIGTERHDSRRIDNQLRGRSGRQGDPGSSRFFLSLEDKLLKNFGADKIANLMNNLHIEDSVPLESVLLTSVLENVQQKVESYYYDIRKSIFDYDQVLNSHRYGLYSERKKILNNYYLKDIILQYSQNSVDQMASLYYSSYKQQNKKLAKSVLINLNELLGLKENIELQDLNSLTLNHIKFLFRQQMIISYDLKEAYWEEIAPGTIRQLEKYYLLSQIDQAWARHLEAMVQLQDAISWRSYAQQDPLIEYKTESFNIFYNLYQYISQSVVYMIMRTSKVI